MHVTATSNINYSRISHKRPPKMQRLGYFLESHRIYQWSRQCVGQLQCRLGDCRNPGFFIEMICLGTLAFTGKENWASFSFPRGQPCALVVILFSNLLYSGLLIFREKKENFAGFSGANSRKNRPIARDFRGRKVKIRRKIG